jgi:hypothetical protein
MAESAQLVAIKFGYQLNHFAIRIPKSEIEALIKQTLDDWNFEELDPFLL